MPMAGIAANVGSEKARSVRAFCFMRPARRTRNERRILRDGPLRADPLGSRDAALCKQGLDAAGGYAVALGVLGGGEEMHLKQPRRGMGWRRGLSARGLSG